MMMELEQMLVVVDLKILGQIMVTMAELEQMLREGRPQVLALIIVPMEETLLAGKHLIHGQEMVVQVAMMYKPMLLLEMMALLVVQEKGLVVLVQMMYVHLRLQCVQSMGTVSVKLIWKEGLNVDLALVEVELQILGL